MTRQKMGTTTYRTAAFAKLAGVTVRALRHYDRLGLLTPRRSSSGYRIYTESDLEQLEEIVALKFIGVPLKSIAAVRRRSNSSFQDTLRAQRQTLEGELQRLRRAIAAIGEAEEVLRAGAPIDAAIFRRIMEVMNMDANANDVTSKYVALLKAKTTHLNALSADARATLQAQWRELVAEIQGSLDEDPASPKAQEFVDRWLSLMQALTGTEPNKVLALKDAQPRATAELRDALWARRAEWLPADVPVSQSESTEAGIDRVRGMMATLADPRVWDFLTQAKAARG